MSVGGARGYSEPPYAARMGAGSVREWRSGVLRETTSGTRGRVGAQRLHGWPSWVLRPSMSGTHGRSERP